MFKPVFYALAASGLMLSAAFAANVPAPAGQVTTPAVIQAQPQAANSPATTATQNSMVAEKKEHKKHATQTENTKKTKPTEAAPASKPE